MAGEDGYSRKIASIYVFNLIVGAGALALPKAFAQTGWLLGTIALAVLALMSYCTSTFMVEAMAIGNAVLRVSSKPSDLVSREPDDLNENGNEMDIPLVINSADIEDVYSIETKVEMGEMARLFFSKAGLMAYYVVIALYLYGDLAIYATAVPKSLTQVICGGNKNIFEDQTLPCANVSNMSVFDMYRISLFIFALCLCPFAFFNLAKTKFLQIGTSIFRWVAFFTMVALAINRLVEDKRNHKTTHHTEVFAFHALPNFFGVAVYSFMCQHSLPSIITPVTNKKRINAVIFGDFASVLIFYLLLVLTAVFAFNVTAIEDLYTLSFTDASAFFKYFLELFPVLTLSTSFPIIAITLRENLKSLFLEKDREYGLFMRRFMFPLITLVPPIIIAFVTDDVGLLVSVTGAYAGAIIQYVIPVMLVFYGRRTIRAEIGGSYTNSHQSPFRHIGWMYVIIAWYVVCLVFVTVNKFL